MAGGDLDGDLYFVCWNKDLLPRKPDYPPMDYPSLPKLEQTEPITTRDMTKFVVDYIRSDQLGVIDNAHKALADIEKDGVQSRKCLCLAELHSLAVDAPKTGKWPSTQGIKIEMFPDFMMKSDKPSYPSEKVIGKLFRRCRKFKDATSEKYDQKLRLDKSFLLPGNDGFVKNAKEDYHWYRDKMESLMRLYGIETEAEIITGCFMKLRNRLRKEKTEISELIGEELFAIRLYLRREFFREFGSDGQWLKDDALISDEMRLKASAWYRVAYTFADDHENDSDPSHEKRLFGFPWFINDVMLAIKTRKDRPSQPQALDVSATVGQSLVRLFNEEKDWLLEEFKARISIKDVICGHLQAAESTSSMSIVGSTATLLFNKTSDLDLSFLPQDTQARSHRALPEVPPEESNTSVEEQAEVLESLIPILKEETSKQQEKKDENVKNLFWKVRLVNEKYFPVLSCKRPTVKLIDSSNCSPTLSCDFSSSPDCLTMAALLSSYIKSYPHLLLVLRAIHRWCCVTRLSRNAAGAGNTSNLLSAVLLAQCIHNTHFNEDHVLETIAHQMHGETRDDKQFMELENVIKYLEAYQNDSQFPQVEPDITQIGQLLMTFFQAHDSLLLFEGSRSQNDHVSLTPYDGRCHQTHDQLAQHLALLENVTNDGIYPYRCFTEKFFQQLRLLERDFDPQVHGCREFAVHFGRIYMFSVPHILLEDSESITIAMLRTNKRKSSVLVRRNSNSQEESAPLSVTYVDQEEERARRRNRQAKRNVTFSETKKKRKRGNPSRSSLFTVVHSPDRVENFLHYSGFRQDGNPTENYSVDI
ncbi:uncharacterized protein LOC113676949, partial [Pocillopora damicornis]|uniref:uncharacterized protein LOC113676949 n=1 Tax=Pocillopora damicornis TaxID=46731 RepID=UPI000F54FB66